MTAAETVRSGPHLVRTGEELAVVFTKDSTQRFGIDCGNDNSLLCQSHISYPRLRQFLCQVYFFARPPVQKSIAMRLASQILDLRVATMPLTCHMQRNGLRIFVRPGFWRSFAKTSKQRSCYRSSSRWRNRVRTPPPLRNVQPVTSNEFMGAARA